MRLFNLLCAASLVASAASAQEIGPEACLIDRDGAAMAELPVDLGDGFVAQSFAEGLVPRLEAPFVILNQCESDAFLLTRRPLLPDGERQGADEVIGAIRAALASEAEFTVLELARRLTALGAPSQLRQSAGERCGCAVFYPELRGDKTPWEAN